MILPHRPDTVEKISVASGNQVLISIWLWVAARGVIGVRRGSESKSRYRAAQFRWRAAPRQSEMLARKSSYFFLAWNSSPMSFFCLAVRESISFSWSESFLR
jgi:hypothetical protein